MKVGVIIQARSTSTRLPGKVLMPLPSDGDTAVLQHVIRRVRRAALVQEIIVATTVNGTDDPIVAMACDEDVRYFRGSEDDVLARFYGAATAFDLDIIVRITSDCPCIDPTIIDRLIEFHRSENADYSSNGITRTYPRGLGAEIMNFDVLEKAHQQAEEPFEREHVTAFIYHSRSASFKVATLSAPAELTAPEIRLTLDTQRDYLFFDALFRKISDASLSPEDFTTADVLRLLRSNRELLLINKDVVQNTLKSEPVDYTNFKKITWEAGGGFNRDNIMLWPSLVIDRGPCLAWYEYSSPTMVQESDVFYCDLDGAEHEPLQLTHHAGYDNGPNLMVDDTGRRWVSWHSWREPGRGPFCRDASTNIWMKWGEKGKWSEAFMPFPSLQATSYPSLIQNDAGCFVMLFSVLSQNRMFTSTSSDGFSWSDPVEVKVPGRVRGDLIASEGRYHIVCEDSGDANRLNILESTDLKKWEVLSCIPDRGTRGKISRLQDGSYALIWQTDNWPAVSVETEVEVTDGSLVLEILPDGCGGNHCWTMNSLKICSDTLTEEFDFGPAAGQGPAKKVNSENALYSPEQRFGFDAAVESMQRSFAAGMASDMVYSSEKRVFRVDVPSALYRVNVLLSSWVSSAKRLTLRVNGKTFLRPGDLPGDKVYYAFSKNLKEWSKPVLFAAEEMEYSRPSKILQDDNGQFYAACTVFDAKKVQIRMFTGR